MDIRIMEYYLAVVREGTISAAAEALHVSQPALSRQIRDLETELGVTLFERGSRRVKLTEEGMILRRRAEEMVRLLQMTENEISRAHQTLSGEIHIGAGESQAFHVLSRIAGEMHREYPELRFTVTSGDTEDLMEQLSNGLIDLALIFTDYDRSLYQGVPLSLPDRLGVLMRRDSELARKEQITGEDLKGLPLIVPRAALPMLNSDPVLGRLNIITVYNLIYNASLFVEDGVGYAIGFDGLIPVTGDTRLTFRPLAHAPSQRGTVIWKKYALFSAAVDLFIEKLKRSEQ